MTSTDERSYAINSVSGTIFVCGPSGVGYVRFYT